VIRDYLTRRAAGFTLLEVLVAMVVLSIGLLGLSGLQTSSLRNNHSAFLRSQATVVSNDIIDRMRANRVVAVNGDYDVAYSASPASSDTVAQLDLETWRAYVGRLPGGDSSLQVVSVSVSGVSYDVAEVRVQWADSRGGGVPLELVTRAQL
jgi:type IV pilus assembly protein PilV